MATTAVSRLCCPLRVLAIHLLNATGDQLRVLFLDRDGHYCSRPHTMPQGDALILASNQRILHGHQAEVRVL